MSILFLTACGGESVSTLASSWEALVDTVGDTVVVRTLSGSIWGDTAYLVPEVTIGTLEGADEYVLGRPQAMAVGENGMILVLDSQVPVVRMYRPSGTHLRDLGKEGSGPGEYRSPDGVAVLPDGRILVRDPPNSRIAVFDESGSYLYQWHLSGGFNSGTRFYVDHGGNSYVTALLDRNLDPWDWRMALIRYSPEGEILDTIPEPTWDFDPPQLTASREGSSSSRDVPFSAEVATGFSPEGYWIGGLSTRYRIDLFRSESQVLRLEKDWVPVSVLPEEAEEQRRRTIQGFQRQYGSWRWNGPGIPDAKPPFKEVFVSWEGNIWVALSTTGVLAMTEQEARAEEAASGRTPLSFVEPWAFDVFSSEGEYLGLVRVPETFQIRPEPVVRGDSVWAVVRDEFDLPSVVRFRVVHP